MAATVNIARTHGLSFAAAQKLAAKWQADGEEKFDLTVTSRSLDVNSEQVSFERKGLSGVLYVTEREFLLELTLGFLFSAYKKKIVETLEANIDADLANK